MNNILRVPPKERLVCTAPGIAGKMVMLISEQKSVSWTIDLVSSLCKPGELVVDTCAGSLASARNYLQLP